MGKHICLNITSDGNKYSSPIPIIGLYIAAGTLVCVIFMICDIIHGLRSRKPWIPCRFFSLNSLTLTLLAIASKLPVDLTTTMPSSEDQFSKLSGTALICLCMNFFSLSLATQSDSERLSNMISLTIFVITVVVNVCIQMVTGVIFSFIVEHVIIMSCVLLLLGVMWDAFKIYTPQFSSSSTIGQLKTTSPLNLESKSMIHRLKSVYVSIHEHSPEFEFLDSPMCFCMCMLSALCALVLLQAALRSLVLEEVKFRCGVSDYKWSMWMVVVTQILIVLVGVIVTILRWLFSIKIVTNEITKEACVCFSPPSWVLSTLSKLHIMSFFKICRRGFMFIFQSIKMNVIMVLKIVTSILYVLASVLSIVFYEFKVCFRNLRNREVMSHMEKKQWIQRSCDEDIKKWTENGRRDSPTHLIQLLSKIPPSQQSLTNKISTTSNENRVSCLLVVVFVRIAIIALPDMRVASLIHTLDEAFEIIYFIEKKINENRRSYAAAKELWMNRGNSCHWFHRRFVKPSVKKFNAHKLKKSMNRGVQSQLQLDLYRALGIIEELKETNDRISYYLFEEVGLAGKEIDAFYEIIIGKESRQAFGSIDELYDHMEKLFVDMLHFFLSQLPLAIFKHLVESPIKQYEERSRFSIKLLCKLEQLEDKVHWTFPDGTGITSLTSPDQVHHSLPDGTSSMSMMITQDPVMDTHCIESEESNLDADVACRVIEDVEIQEVV